MSDAQIQAERPLVVHLNEFETTVRSTLEKAAAESVVDRIWRKDASLWKSEPSHVKIISNSLGWLTVPQKILDDSAELLHFAEKIRTAGEFQHVMVCGMGGSSLCPEVLRQTFGKQEGFPELLVLDSTDPDVIAAFASQIEITHCLFIIASKSGTTTEPVAFHRFWYHEVEQAKSNPGTSFIAITDPDTLMARTAVSEEFRHVFLNPSDIGGRYSALSYFGMVTAALMGLDIKDVLTRSIRMSKKCGPEVPVGENPAALLGAVIADCAVAGRDKLTIVTDVKLSAVGLWIEQLVAESTGKEGKGIVPVMGEPLGPPSVYGNDRLFVSIATGPHDEESIAKLKALEDAGHPVVYRQLESISELGAEFFLWEMATAFAGWRLGINPFDQPNVQESKDMTKALLERFAVEGKLDEQAPAAIEGSLKFYTGEPANLSATEVIGQYMDQVKQGDYIALLAYVEETPEIDAALQELRASLRDATGCATTVGYGPRFLHSTGQLHKGGPDTGVFIQLTAPDKSDFEVPSSPYSFSILKRAQAQGDLEALLAHGRRALRVDLGDNVVQDLERLRVMLAGSS